MKLSKFVSLLLVALIATVAASGCRKKPVGITKIPPGATGGNPADPADKGQPLPPDQKPDQNPVEPQPLPDPKEFENWPKDPDMFKPKPHRVPSHRRSKNSALQVAVCQAEEREIRSQNRRYGQGKIHR